MVIHQAGQDYLGRLRWIDSGYGIILDVALPVEPVTEGSDGTVVGVLAVTAVEVGKEQVDVSMSEFIIGNEWLEARFIELNCSRRDTLPSEVDERRQEEWE